MRSIKLISPMYYAILLYKLFMFEFLFKLTLTEIWLTFREYISNSLRVIMVLLGKFVGLFTFRGRLLK